MASSSSSTRGRSDFKWTDDEAELLLNVTHNYKIAKITENVDWESVKTKYDDILALMKDELPSTADEAKEMTKEYPHTKEEMTKKVLSTKLKAVRGKFREAVDSGRRSGHGRVVLLYYELCEKIWGGSPATEQIDNGIESADINNDDETSPTSPTSSSGEGDHSAGPPSVREDTPTDEQEQTVEGRKQYLDRKLGSYRTEKMKRKLPVDTQLLSCAKEDLVIKKRLVEQMDRFDKEYSESMQKLTSNIEKVGNSIAEGFTVLKQLIGTPHMPMPFPYQPPMYNPCRPMPSGFDMSYSQSFDSPSSPNPYTLDNTSGNFPVD